MSATRRERISAVDTAWLRMDRPANLMMICGVLMFGQRVSLARLRRVIEERFLVFRRFRDCAVQTAALSYWRVDRAFDLDAHVVATRLGGDAGDRELQALVSEPVKHHVWIDVWVLLCYSMVWMSLCASTCTTRGT